MQHSKSMRIIQLASAKPQCNQCNFSDTAWIMSISTDLSSCFCAMQIYQAFRRDIPSSVALPTLDRLGATIPDDLDAKTVAATWFNAFASYAEAGDVKGVASLFVPDGFWRDILALTWDFRTFSGLPAIEQFLADRLQLAQLKAFRLQDEYLGLQQPYPDLAWISAMFEFETQTGIASGVFRLVPLANGEWKAHTIFTNLEDLKGFPEKIGALRNQHPNHGKWAEQRRCEIAFEDKDPIVLIVGGGQAALALAARLKSLDISTLIVEKNPRVGDNWRNRYEALCLHDPVWYDHMPYIPFPPTWPVYTPSLKLANWLESYADSLELNVWTSSTVIRATQDDLKKWRIIVNRKDGGERQLTVNHVVMATGLASNVPNIPSFPGMEAFKGEILHSSQHTKAMNHAGKKVVVVGSATSAHDICVDYYEHGIDVTMIQRGSTYVMSIKNGWKILLKGSYSEDGMPADIADRLSASSPHFMGIGLTQRRTKLVAEADKEILDALRKRGFRVSMGMHGTGFSLLARTKLGGYYLDTGGSQLIADGSIKLKNDSPIECFTETGLKFENGSELSADVVVFATGLGDARAGFTEIFGDAVVSKLPLLWGFNSEGETNGVWRDLGVRGLWYMSGNLARCRFHSKHVALQIKAIEEDIVGKRYAASN